jgi:galactokinase
MKKYFSPGRVNLIGEHLDYNGGLVLPATIQLGITATLTPRSDNQLTLRSANHSFTIAHDLTHPIKYNPANDWANYPLGIIHQLITEGHAIHPCDLYFESTLPEGSGLSSSAALEVLTGYALLSQTESRINRIWLANLCQQVENEFIGVKCGIMDQMSVALGKKDHALLLDCATLKHENYVPFELGPYRLLIMNSKKPRSLITSKYNERKTECDEALRIIQATQPDVKHLAQAPPHLLDLISDETIRINARNMSSAENYRVKEAVKVLTMNDLSTFGRLMNASHALRCAMIMP